MRVDSPSSFFFTGAAIRGGPETISQPAGRSGLLSYNSHANVGVDVEALAKFPTCQAPSIRLPLGVDGATVGRCMIVGDTHLRSFSVAKPWARVAAGETGPDALMAWEEEEQVSPPTGTALGISETADAALNSLMDSIPAPEIRCNVGARMAISEMGGTLIRRTCDVTI